MTGTTETTRKTKRAAPSASMIRNAQAADPIAGELLHDILTASAKFSIHKPSGLITTEKRTIGSVLNLVIGHGEDPGYSFAVLTTSMTFSTVLSCSHLQSLLQGFLQSSCKAPVQPFAAPCSPDRPPGSPQGPSRSGLRPSPGKQTSCLLDIGPKP